MVTQADIKAAVRMIGNIKGATEVELDGETSLWYAKNTDQRPLTTFRLDVDLPCVRTPDLNSFSTDDAKFESYPSERQIPGCGREP